jgi:DNA-binding response OmpR family regulator
VKRTVILLIEDDPADALMVREALKTAAVPVELTVAEDGERALALLTEQRLTPDLVILDLSIPRISGLSFLEKYHPKERPPVVVFSSTWDQTRIQHALNLGVREFIHKPMAVQAYGDAVRGMVRKWALKAA